MPDQSPSLFDTALAEYQKALAPLTKLRTAAQLAALLKALGYELTGEQQLGQIADAFNGIAADVEKLPGLAGGLAEDQSLGNTVKLISTVADCVERIMRLGDSLEDVFKGVDPGGLAGMAAALPRRLLDYLVCVYLRDNHCRIFAVTSLLGITKTEDAPLAALAAAPGEEPQTVSVSVITWQYIPDLLTNISGVLKTEYNWDAGADVNIDLLFKRLADLMSAFMLPGGLYPQDPAVSGFLGFDKIPDGGVKEIRIPLYQDGAWPDAYAETGLVLSPLANARGAAGGLALMPYAGESAKFDINLNERFKLEFSESFKTSGGIVLMLRPPAEAEFGAMLSADLISAELGAQLLQNKKMPIILVGDQNSSRLSVDMLGARFFASLACGSCDLGIELSAEDIELVISKGDGDGFLQKVLPDEPFAVTCGLAIGYSAKKGFYVKEAGQDSAGVEYSVTLDKKIGIITIQSMLLRLTYGDSAIKLVIALSGGLNIGPVAASVSQIGLEAAVKFAGGGAELTLGFKPPNGVGLVIDSAVIKGGGYLSIDTEKGRYVGILQVKMMSLGITIYGLLDTKDAAGKPLKSGYSLLLMVFCEFSPIQLGFGFVLTGIGGLLALHRSLDTDVLREQMRNRALDYIMFPSDPIGQAPAMTDTLSKIFPTQDGVFVIAPMVRIGWGSPDPMLKVDIGIMLELPSFNKIVLLGRMKLALPDEKDPVAVINLDSLGILRLDEGSLSLDAELYDSKIAILAISGEMALRLNWKGDKQFLFSMGGYHPAFKAPPGFPSLKRMAATLSIDDWFHLRLESYMALTSNTLQFGARVDLDATIGDIVGKGSLFFDALMYFNPFGLQVDFGASISIEVYGINLFAVSFDAHLAGPSPWHVWGTAKFHVLFVDLEFKLDARIGDSAPSAPPDPVDIEAAVLAEIAHAANWGALPPDGFQAVTLRQAKTADGDILLHPLGSLQFSQKALPLNTGLDKFGNALIRGANLIEISGVTLGDASGPGPAPLDTPELYELYEDFAPAQYFSLTEAQKLASPSFVRYTSGFAAAYDAVDFDDQSAETDFDYETVYEDTTGEAPVGAAGVLKLPRLPVRREIILNAVSGPRELAIAASLGVSARTGARAKALRFSKPTLL